MLRFMASWSESNAPRDEVPAPNETRTATAVGRARSLLKQLFAGRPRDDRPPHAKQ